MDATATAHSFNETVSLLPTLVGAVWQPATKASFTAALRTARDRNDPVRLVAHWCYPAGVPRTLASEHASFINLSGPDCAGVFQEASRCDLGKAVTARCLTYRSAGRETLIYCLTTTDGVNTHLPLEMRTAHRFYFIGPDAWTVAAA